MDGARVSRPLVVGVGGTARPGSSTERALAAALRAAEAAGAETRLFGGEFLARLPHFNPSGGVVTPEQAELVEAVRRADGLVVASPGYHGSLSGMIKNALDTLELLRDDERPYLHGRAVGAIVTADGWQAAGATLAALRSIIHAMRGWPTPFGAALNATTNLFDAQGACIDARDAWQLATVGEQVMEFARMKAGQ
jgi:FMN reductase